MRLVTALLAPALLSAACAGSSDPVELVQEGERALGRGDDAAAIARFDEVLAALGPDTGHPLYRRAWLGSIEARAEADPVGAKDDLIALSRADRAAVTDADFNRIAARIGAEDLIAASDLLEEAKAVYPESEHLDRLGELLVRKAQTSDVPDALERLESLGYMSRR